MVLLWFEELCYHFH